MGIMDRVERLRRQLVADPVVSLDAPVGNDPDAPALGDVLPADGPSAEAEVVDAARRALLARRLRQLDPREQVAVALRFASWNPAEIGVEGDICPVLGS